MSRSCGKPTDGWALAYGEKPMTPETMRRFNVCPCKITSSGYVYRKHVPNCPNAFIENLEKRAMSTWTEEEMHRYNELTDQC